MQYDMKTLVDMMCYKRKHGTQSHKEFCREYLSPVFGAPDEFGNYTRIIGDKPRVAWMSHHDSVHSGDGIQKLHVGRSYVYEKYVAVKGSNTIPWYSKHYDNIMTDYVHRKPSYNKKARSVSAFKTMRVDTSNVHAQLAKANRQECLGADCATGMWLMLGMIEAGIEGVYVIHAEEESGCIGSKALVASKPDWLDHVDAAISFDRKDYNSIITHQTGARTCSDAFANSLSDAIGLAMIPDSGGSFTDSNAYRGVIAECTNVSVGYFDQHTRFERQDLTFAMKLMQNMCSGSFNSLKIEREPVIEQYRSSYFGRGYAGLYGGSSFYGEDESYGLTIDDLVHEHPSEIAMYLEEMGINPLDLADALIEINSDLSIDLANSYNEQQDLETRYYEDDCNAWSPNLLEKEKK